MLERFRSVAPVLLLGVFMLMTFALARTIARAKAQAIGRVMDAKQRQLDEIEPYARHKVSTHVEDDGALVVEQNAWVPRLTEPKRFELVLERVLRERFEPDAPAGAIAERVEEIRQRADAATSAARDAYQTLLVEHEDAKHHLAERRALSTALSNSLNADRTYQ